MILTCPSCSTRYLVDPQALGASGRSVRCANCSHTWFQTPPEDSPQPLEMPPRPATESSLQQDGVLDTPSRVQLPAVPPRRRPLGRILGWLAALVILAALAIALVVARQGIINLWPPAARLYTMIGFPVAQPGMGLELRKVAPSRGTENGLPTLSIDGEVMNVSTVARSVPKLRVVLRDNQQHELQAWTISVSDEPLLPGASVPFHTSVTQPSEAATGVVVTFLGGAGN